MKIQNSSDRREITMKEILCFGDSNTYGLIPGTKNVTIEIQDGRD